VHDEFDPGKFFDMLRKSASVKAGAMMFGEAQVAYYDVLKQHMSDDEAYSLLAHTTEVIMRSLASTAAPLAEVMLKAASVIQMYKDQFGDTGTGDKEVPGA
jgi:hypothetical protein